jgi:hypothetical protein
VTVAAGAGSGTTGLLTSGAGAGGATGSGLAGAVSTAATGSGAATSSGTTALATTLRAFWRRSRQPAPDRPFMSRTTTVRRAEAAPDSAAGGDASRVSSRQFARRQR